MPSIRRCVFGCVTKGVTIHNFPNPSKFPERFRQWVNLVGEPLIGISDADIYANKKVCDIHFTNNDRNRNSRLNALAVPSLHLPQTLNVTIHQNMDADQVAVPSTSKIMPPSGTLSVTIHQNMDADQVAVPSTSKIMPPSGTLNTANLPNMNVDQILAVQSTSQILPPSGTSNIANQQNMDVDKIFAVQSTSQILPPSGPKKAPVQKTTIYNQTQKDIRKLKHEILRLRKRCHNFKTRLESAEKLSTSLALQKVTSRMSLPGKLFTNMQFRESNKKPKGHRFHLDEKILSLSLYKRSPKSYSLMSKCFTLPSAKTLRNLLGKIKIKPGINKPLFKKIKMNVNKMSHDERLCTLIFDEMHINPQIHFDAQNDELKGFDSFKNTKIADHVLTFMVRGIKKQYKQPVAFYFSQSMTKNELKQVIKTVITEINNTGLKILATVCDQSAVNVGAIESLVEDTKAMFLRYGKAWRTNMFLIEQQSIIPLYDVPHLFKGIRNNLISKNLKYIDIEDKKEKIIKWEYFINLYKSDRTYGELKILQKFTEEHVLPEKMNKMKVKLATQLFSHSVAIAAKHLCDAGKLDPECRALVPFVLFMDKLFDSLNSNTFSIVNGKMYRAGVKSNSPHHKLWQDAIVFFKNMNFIDIQLRQSNIRLIERKVPSINNFIKTIEGMQALWKILHTKHGFDTMLTRNFNQDPIENFFGSIRSLGIRNVSPNYINFEGAYKALLLNNFCSSHSIKTNCEDDMASYFQSLDFLLKKCEESDNSASDADLPQEIIINESILLNNYDAQEGIQQRSYVCGWVLKKCLKYVCKTCKTCRSQLIDKENINENRYITDKEYQNKQWLVYPSKELISYFNELQNLTTTMLKESLEVKNVRKNIEFINDTLNNYIFQCESHKVNLKKYFDDNSINILIYSWCRSINRILSGKITYDGNDPVKISAQMYYNKNKHNKVKK